MKKIGTRINGIILTALSLLLTVGSKLIFPACGPKEDGSWMTCHWSEQAVFGMGAALTVISVIVLIAGNSRTALGASLAAIPLAVLTALTPGVLIGLCMMENMRCHTTLRPAVAVISVLIAAAAAVNAFIIIRKERKSR